MCLPVCDCMCATVCMHVCMNTLSTMSVHVCTLLFFFFYKKHVYAQIPVLPHIFLFFLNESLTLS